MADSTVRARLARPLTSGCRDLPSTSRCSRESRAANLDASCRGQLSAREILRQIGWRRQAIGRAGSQAASVSRLVRSRRGQQVTTREVTRVAPSRHVPGRPRWGQPPAGQAPRCRRDIRIPALRERDAPGAQAAAHDTRHPRTALQGARWRRRRSCAGAGGSTRAPPIPRRARSALRVGRDHAPPCAPAALVRAASSSPQRAPVKTTRRARRSQARPPPRPTRRQALLTTDESITARLPSRSPRRLSRRHRPAWPCGVCADRAAEQPTEIDGMASVATKRVVSRMLARRSPTTRHDPPRSRQPQANDALPTHRFEPSARRLDANRCPGDVVPPLPRGEINRGGRMPAMRGQPLPAFR